MKRKIVIFVLIGAAAVAATALYAGWFGRDKSLEASGTVEARNIRVGSEVGGRIEKVLVREGDTVHPGQEIVTFDDKELTASLEEARANAVKMQRGYRAEDVAQARAAAAQAKADYEMKRNGYRQQDISAAQADLDRTTADETRTRLDFERYEALSKKDLVSKQQRDAAEAAWKMALAQKEIAAQKVNEMHQGYRPEEIAAAEAQYHQAQATLDKYERGNRPEDIAAAKASLAYQEARYRERRVLAPAEATVEVLDVRPGDLVAPNTPIATLLEADQLYVRVYIPETEYGRIQLGQKVEIRVDSFPKQVFQGTVEQINQQAEFLPRNVQTRSDREHQVFGIKVRVDDTSHRILAGMAANVKFVTGH
jgi:multidrug resistance efflux pump